MNKYDYQWPQPSNLISYFPTTDWQNCKSLYVDLEVQLTQKFGYRAVLMPSGRAGISSILEFLRASRDHLIFAPKYSSNCIWDLIGRVSNPTIKFNNEVDFVIAVHKWGYVSNIIKTSEVVLIEDSVDSLIIESSGLFPLGGDFEIFSLPKLIGSQSGAVVLSKNENYIEWIKETRFQDKELILSQSFLKYKRIKDRLNNHESPDLLESKNRGLDIYALKNIISTLSNFKINQLKIKERLDALNYLIQLKKPQVNYSRLPPVFPLSQRFFDVRNPNLFMQRYFDFNLSLNAPDFYKSWILPLHFGVEDSTFMNLLSNIKLRKNGD